MFERLLMHWLVESAAAEAEQVETWRAFRERVRRALDRIMEGPDRGRRVAAFTSGGVIGAVVAHALDAPAQAALELSWRVRNASLTRLIFTRGRLSLDEFNTMPHMADLTQWTYR
jgi:broad specificity phosphatase PhoE